MKAKAGQLPLLSKPGVGKPDRGSRSRWLSVARTWESILSVLQASGARPFTFWASAISSSSPPLRACRGPSGAGHRLDHGADGRRWTCSIGGQGSQRVRVGWGGQLVQVFSGLGEQTDVDLLTAEIQSGVNIEVGPPFSSLRGDSRSVSPEGAPPHGSPKQGFEVGAERPAALPSLEGSRKTVFG